MEKIGIICEYNPFHNGHIYHIDSIKKMYPNSLIILVINGYFMQRGDISLMSKFDKVKIALENNVDIVVELPTLFASQSADNFAKAAIYILDKMGADKVIFGSESNNINILKDIALKQEDTQYNENVKKYLNKGENFPTSLAKALNIDFTFNSNDLLGISYIKAINKLNSKIIPLTIQRTNNYLDNSLDDNIVSASNIREKYLNNTDIQKYVPKATIQYLTKPNNDYLFFLLKHLILTSDNLSQILDVDEGIEHRLKEKVVQASSLEQFILKVKTKRFTYNKIRRMIIHILLNIKKNNNILVPEYIKILGFNKNGKKYLSQNRKNIKEYLKINKECLTYKIEINSSILYDQLTGQNNFEKELQNKPIII